MAYKHILVAIDLGDEAEQVLAAAGRMIESLDCEQVSVVSVIRPLNHVYGGIDGGMLPAEFSLEGKMRTDAEQRLAKLIDQARLNPNNIYVQYGQPATEIKGLAGDKEADLIVIGTHGRHGLGLLLGSTANGVLHGVPCDVLTIKIQT